MELQHANLNIWLIFGAVMILSWIVSAILKSKFKKYSKIPTDNGMSG
jgi:Zn-dependent membrane protease YugP